MNPQLIPLTRPLEAKAAGIPVETVDQLRWMERTADEKGLRQAFICIGRRKYIDPVRFHELVRGGGHAPQRTSFRGDSRPSSPLTSIR